MIHYKAYLTYKTCYIHFIYYMGDHNMIVIEKLFNYNSVYNHFKT